MAAKKKSRKPKTVKSKKQEKARKPKARQPKARQPKARRPRARRPNAARALASEPTVDDVLHQWLSQSIPGQPIPNADQLQVAWASFGSGGAFTVQVQQDLANRLNTAFAPDPPIVAANLPGTLTVGQLKANLNRP
jgi:hypothetical protein